MRTRWPSWRYQLSLSENESGEFMSRLGRTTSLPCPEKEVVRSTFGEVCRPTETVNRGLPRGQLSSADLALLLALAAGYAIGKIKIDGF